MVSLTQQQLDVINADVGQNLKVVAVPGSGKSTVLVHRIRHFLVSGFPPERILVIMFGDSAAVNFRTSLEELDFMNLPDVKTYHSLGRRVCSFLSNAGFLPKFTLQTEQHAYKKFYRSVLASTIPDHLHSKLNPKRNDVLDDFLRFVELVKSHVVSPEEVFKAYNYVFYKQIYIAAFKLAEERRWQDQIQFFSDLVYDAVLVCTQNEMAYRSITNRFDVILVDEYQDSNKACHELLRIIAGTRATINVVGDDDQTIYDFTGSSPIFLISQIDKDFSDVKSFSLSLSFRFGHSVALIANNVINNNKERIPKLCVSGREDLYTHISILSYSNDIIDCDQEDLVKHISAWITEHGTYKDIAILFRQYSNTFGIELALLRNAIPYFIARDKGTILHTRDARFLFSCLGILCQYTDIPEMTKLKNMFNYLTGFIWGIKFNLLKNTVKCLTDNRLDDALSEFAKVKGKIKPKDSKEILRRMKTYDKVRRTKNYTTRNLLQKLIFDAGFSSSIAKANWRDPVFATVKFNALFDFFVDVSSNVDDVHRTLISLRNRNDNCAFNDGVELTTLHKSKGLAWPFVVLPYLEEGIIPSSSSMSEPYQVEVERRLFYVGITRATHKLAFHVPHDLRLLDSLRMYQGTMNEVDHFRQGKASRYVYETNLLSTTQIAVELANDESNSVISHTDNRHLYNKYLYAIGKQFRISGLAKHS